MIEKTQEQTMQNWIGEDSPLVSVRCTTFNHESYINECIEGFLIQETSFPFYQGKERIQTGEDSR